MIGLNNKTWCNDNRLIIGGTGSGKTTTEVIPFIRSTNESFVVTDTKGNLYRKNREDLKRRGFKVFLLDLNDPIKSGGYNPLRYIGRRIENGMTKYSEKDIFSLSNTLVPVSDSREPYWDNMARQLLSMLIAFVLEDCPEEEQNLVSVIEAFGMMSGQISTMKKCTFMEAHYMMHPDSLSASIYRMISSVFSSDRTWGCIESFLVNALRVYQCEDVKKLLTEKSNFRIEELGQKKCALFINVSDNDSMLDPVVSTFYTQCFQTLLREADRSRGSRLKVPVRIILDDFAASCAIPDFDNLISVIRSRSISATVVLQSLSQLESRYGSSRSATIIMNCDTLIYLGGCDLSTVDYIAKRMDLPAEKVMNMPLDTAYHIVRGEKAKYVKKTLPEPLQEQPDAEPDPEKETDKEDTAVK